MPVVNGTTYHEHTHPRVIQVLEDLMRSRDRVRIYYGDQFPPYREWGGMPERGRISRSMGPEKIPLIINNSRSMGGGGILTNSIIRIEASPNTGRVYFDIRQNPPPYWGIGPWSPREAIERGEMDFDEGAVWSDYVTENGAENLGLDYEALQRLKQKLKK